MFLTEYDEKKVLEMEREEGRQEGRQEGREEGIDDFSDALEYLYQQGRDKEAREALKDKQFRSQIMNEYIASRKAIAVL